MNLKNELLAFQDGFLFSLLKGIYNTCAIHTQVNKQASVARILFAGFFGIFSTSINKRHLDAQIKENNTKISTTPNTYYESRNKTNTTPTAPQLQNLNHNHPLSLVPRNFRNIALTNLITSRSNYPRSPIYIQLTIFFSTSPIVLETLKYKATPEITISSPRCISSVPYTIS